MYWAFKKTDGHIVVQEYTDINLIKETYQNYEVAKIILPYFAEDLEDASIQAGNRLEGGRFILMEKQKNGLEIPKRYDPNFKRKSRNSYKRA